MAQEQTTEQLDIHEYFARPIDVEHVAEERTRKSSVMLDQSDVLDMLEEVIATAKREQRGRLSLKDATTMLIRAGFHSYKQREQERAGKQGGTAARKQPHDLGAK